MDLVSKQPMPNDMKDAYERLHQEVSGLHAKWKIFRQLYSASEERIALLRDTTPGFFGLIQLVLLDDISLSISRLTDPLKSTGKDNLSLQRLVERIEAETDADFLVKTQKSIEGIQEHCSAFRVHRNRRIAHRDLKTVFGYHPEPLPNIEGKKIDDALKMIAAFMNEIQGRYEDAETAYDQVIIQGDGDDLVFFLSQAVEYNELKFKNIRGNQ